MGTDFADPLCARDLRLIDEQVVFVEDMLGSWSDEPIEIYLYRDHPPVCSTPEVGGCFVDGVVASDWAAFGHEVVHAVVARFAAPSPLWEEGAAVALDRHGTHRGGSTPLANEDLRASELDYATAGHFVRWLLETTDPSLLGNLLEGSSPDELLGHSMAELSQQYEAHAPWAYPPWVPCDAPALPSVGPGTWQETVDISCEHPDASRFEGQGVSVLRTVELDEGLHELELSESEGIRILGCQLDALAEPPPPFVHGDVPNAAELSQTALGVLFEGGRAHTLDLTAGTYRLAISAGAESRTVSVTLRRVAP